MIQYIFKQNNTMHVWLPCKHQLSIISLSVTKTNAVKAASFYIFPLQFQRWHRNPIITTHSIYSGHTSRSRVAITGTPTAEKPQENSITHAHLQPALQCSPCKKHRRHTLRWRPNNHTVTSQLRKIEVPHLAVTSVRTTSRIHVSRVL